MDKHTPTPESKAAHMLWCAFDIYRETFGVPVNGTLKQLEAVLCLGAGREIVRAVNSHHELLACLKATILHISLCNDRDEDDPISAGIWRNVDRAKQAIAKAEGQP